MTFWDLALHTPDQLLSSHGLFTQFLAVVRAEKRETEQFTQVTRDVTEKGERDSHRTTLRCALRESFGEIPTDIYSAIEACNDVDKLEKAILRAATLTSLADFKL